jgi:hypothetical protein
LSQSSQPKSWFRELFNCADARADELVATFKRKYEQTRADAQALHDASTLTVGPCTHPNKQTCTDVVGDTHWTCPDCKSGGCRVTFNHGAGYEQELGKAPVPFSAPNPPNPRAASNSEFTRPVQSGGQSPIDLKALQKLAANEKSAAKKKAMEAAARAAAVAFDMATNAEPVKLEADRKLKFVL